MAKQASFGVEFKNINRFKRAMKLIGDGDAPYLRAALNDAGEIADDEVSHFAPGALASAVAFTGVKGSGANSKAVIKVRHPGARPMEFGRTMYYRGWTGKPRGRGYIKGHGGTKFKVARGQAARPYVGLRNKDKAIESMSPKVTKMLGEAVQKEWARVLGSGGE